MATSNAQNARGSDNARATFYLQIRSAKGGVLTNETYSSWSDLAEAVQMLHPVLRADRRSGRVRNGIVEAFSCNDKAIDLSHLLASKLQTFTSYYGRRCDVQGYVRRQTPVPYTAKFRGGSGYYRSIGTQQEIRQNHAVEWIEEDGYRLVRSARRAPNLPNAYDDISRARKNGWKVQHRGAKAWDHPPRHGSLKEAS